MAFQNIAGRLVDVIFGYDFFISYTWADGSKYAHSLCEKLKAQGFTVFLDEEEYVRGDNWTLLGRRALKKTRQLALIVTPRVHESGPVLKELTAFHIYWETNNSDRNRRFTRSREVFQLTTVAPYSRGTSQDQSASSTRCVSERSSSRGCPRTASRFSACSTGSDSRQSSSRCLPSVVRPSFDCGLAGHHRRATAEKRGEARD